MKDTLTVELTEEEVAFLRELLFAYDDNAQSLDEMYLNLIEKIDFDTPDTEDDDQQSDYWDTITFEPGGYRDPIPFEIGEVVKVISKLDLKIKHGFEVGTLIKIIEIDDFDMTIDGVSESGLAQWVYMSGVEKVEETE